MPDGTTSLSKITVSTDLLVGLFSEFRWRMPAGVHGFAEFESRFRVVVF